MRKRTYVVNAVFYTLQGEGVRAGTPNVFVRFAACNLECRRERGRKSPGGFDCDTEFAGGRPMTAADIVREARAAGGPCRAIVLTGGEPALQVDAPLIAALKKAGYYLAIETNGSIKLPRGLDWICVSPKVAEHAIRQRTADEVKYVRARGQALPRTVVKARHYLISPAWEPGAGISRSLAWCVELCRRNPPWRLSVQQHKAWAIP